MTIALVYPHIAATLEPQRLFAAEIWKLGEEARGQITSGVDPKLDLSELISGSRHLLINGLEFETRWEFSQPIFDDEGRPAYGALEFDPQAGLIALASINGELLRDRDEMARSTVAHELAHAVFDAPGWMRAAHCQQEIGQPRRFRSVTRHPPFRDPADWVEWRANEFMGGFLAPRTLLHREMLNVAKELWVPRLRRPRGLLVLDGRRAGADRIQSVLDELAERFALSSRFIEIRLKKYQLIDLASE